MTQALYYKPSFERLRGEIGRAAPDLDIVLYDEAGRFWRGERELRREDIDPAYFWIHGELFGSPRLRDYFSLMLEAPNARWLHTINTGLDQLPYLDLLRRGVSISNNHAQAIAIAEFTIGQVLAHYQDVVGLRECQARGEWRGRRFRELSGSHWLLVGFGHIGQCLAERLRPFGVRVTALRRRLDSSGLADAVIGREALPAALGEADVVVLSCASNPQTRGMVDAAFLGAMKAGSVLVNIARGDLVVESDLRAALDAGRPEYAILDVFNQEPPAPESWVWRHPRAALSAHCSNAGTGMGARSDRLFLDNLARIRAGRPLLNEVAERDIL